MQNGRVTEDDIRAAVAALRERGAAVTQENIRQELGGGSMSTINKYMRQLRDGDASQQQLPERLLAVVRLLVAETRAVGADEIKAIRAESDAAVEAAELEIATAQALRTRAEDELRQVQQRLADSERTREQQAGEVQRLQLTLDQERAAATQHAQALKGQLDQAQAGVSQLRTELETRTRELDQVRAQHRGELETRAQELTQVRGELEARAEDLAQARAEVVQQRAEADTRGRLLEQARKDLAERGRELAGLREDLLQGLRTEIQQMGQQLNERLTHLEQQGKTSTESAAEVPPPAEVAPAASTPPGKATKAKSATPAKRTAVRA